MRVELFVLRRAAVMTLSLNRIGTDSGWATRTQVSKRYERVDPAKLIDRLMKM